MEELKIFQKFGEVTSTPLFSVDKVTWHSSPEKALDVYKRLQKHYAEMEKERVNTKSKKR